MSDPLQSVLGYGYTVVFVAVFTEQIGLPLPSAPILMAAGALAGFHRLNVVETLSVAVVASVIADCFWFYLGRQRGNAILSFVCKVSLEPETCVLKTYSAYTRYGPASFLFSKFVPGAGVLGPPMAGLLRLSPWTFLAMDGAGALIWSGSFVAAGWMFRTQLQDIADLGARLGSYFSVLLALGLAVYIVSKYVRRRRIFRELQIARITAVELKRLMDEGKAPIVVDVRLDIEKRAGQIPGAIGLADLDSMPESLKAGEFVLYCSCPNEMSAVQAALKLRRRGVHHVRPLQGGFQTWLELGFPVKTETPVLPNDPIGYSASAAE